MGRRNYWNAVRMVANNIELGDRSFSNLTRIPDLPTSGWAAIRELEEKGLVTVTGYSVVEPTPAFGPWLHKLKLEETEQAIARQREIYAPWHGTSPKTQQASSGRGRTRSSRGAKQSAFFDEGAREDQITSSLIRPSETRGGAGRQDLIGTGRAVWL
jgi:hypothetical protein